MAITRFKDEYFWLSNMYPHEIIFEGMVYPSSENAYQAAKQENISERFQFQTITARESKMFGQSMPLRPDWDNIKKDVMLKCLRSKFSDVELAFKLISTGKQKIIEGNVWHDNFWGDCQCFDCADTKGENNLGKLLMQVRKELQEKFEDLTVEAILIIIERSMKHEKGK